jgi:N,N'-diacetyllegionaminate synthase
MMATIIAELCQNHNGDKKLLSEMISAAAEAGAEYVKVQSMLASEITYRERFEEGVVDSKGVRQSIFRPYQAEVDRLAPMDLSDDDFKWFIDECENVGVEPMTTIFTRQRIPFLSSLGMKAVKVASYDCGAHQLIQDLRDNFDHLVVSTGASYNHEIENTADILKGTSYDLLHCVTIYPTPMEELHLNRMNYLRQFTSTVGFSDHSLVARDGIDASILALGQGAEVIERHFTIQDAKSSRDGPVSINPEELKRLVEFGKMSSEEIMDYVHKNIPNWKVGLGQEQRDMSPEELLNRDYYSGRFASMIEGKPVYNWETDWKLEELV